LHHRRQSPRVAGPAQLLHAFFGQVDTFLASFLEPSQSTGAERFRIFRSLRRSEVVDFDEANTGAAVHSSEQRGVKAGR
jgi:hypothetical protein